MTYRTLTIYQVGATFALFYIGSDEGSRYRQIGVATATAISGPWTRSEGPLDLGVKSDANNPAACFEPDGSISMRSGVAASGRVSSSRRGSSTSNPAL